MAIHGGASWLAAVSLSLLALALQGAAAETLVPAMFVFGDSTVDVGNNNFLERCNVSCKANYPHFGVDYIDQAPTGRFSNGYNLADQLAQLLGFAESPPPLLSLSNATSLISRMSTGISFAHGGSGIRPETGNGPVCTQVVSMAEQVRNFTNLARLWASGNDNRSSAADLLSQSLFFISTGSNDLFEYADIGPQNNDTELLQGLVASYAAYLKDLYSAGAKRFSVVSTSLVGCCPSQLAIAHDPSNPKGIDKYGCFAALNNLSGQLYPMFDAMLQGLSQELPGMNYSLVNSIKMAEWVFESPATPTYNFTVLDIACCGGGQFGADGCNSSAPLCPNRSNHLFWDDYHTTEAASRIAASMIFSDPTGLFVHPINVHQLVGGGAAATVDNTI
ncbi:GDSL esterase/lipase At5g55050 [Zea mays]|uniref:GDSL esterase/lipase At5g55050 n=1 Tax=Zea mays TaxID=4577 RepID=UPI0009AA15EA|nr:GDSL esterase/lipase At5g55050 [Zea mays]|eukprot:XP_020401108.1 GDSL esterase/lipase At5g55050 [Zea mays]